ncbi:FAD/NAD(P)-binding domain-containing protein [Pyrenochaeta sp. DS3sAY3a]|nr:FAD/NAD(P)-binding domain-containing protein [Pyrenochaeta sp. DS3sAY3a]
MASKNQQPLRDPLDLLIIGAGIYGVQAARTYLTIHPTHNILVLEAGNSPGGVWSKDRMYPHFFTQAPLDIWEYSDKVLKLPEGEETYYKYFPAKHFATYLDEYATEHVFNGRSVKERILCDSAVTRLSTDGQVWEATTSSGATYHARKVIDATGLTSLANIPHITGKDTFKGLQFHSKDFGRNYTTILKPENRVVILGGGKSAGDVAYACAKSGVKEINWVIRQSGNGPAAYLPADPPVKKYSDSNSAFHTSFMATVTACVYTQQTWWTWFLYRTLLGRGLLSLIWMGVQSDVYGRPKYNRQDTRAKESGFANLKPDGPLFWQLSSSGVNQRPDFFDTIAEKATVHRQNMERISASSVVLENGKVLNADIIIYATGWNANTPFIDPQLAYDLGLVTPLSTATSPPNLTRESHWHILEKHADAQVLQRFPCLAAQPPFYRKPQSTTPFRLYHSLFPIPTSSAPPTPPIAFLGRTNFANGTYASEIQALYVTAVFDGHIKLPAPAAMEDRVALVNAWMKRRYPAKGGRGDFLFFDVVPYTDMLLGELGMGRVSEGRGLFGAMGAGGLRGVLEGYLEGVYGRKKTV